MPRHVLDAVEDPVAGGEEVLLDADVRVHRVALVAVRQVRARRPHEVAAEAVDVVRELDVRERVRDPELVLDLGLGRLRTGPRTRRWCTSTTRRCSRRRSSPTVLLRFRSTPHRLREAGSVLTYGTPLSGLRPRRPEVGRERVVGLLAALDAVVRQVAPLHVEVVHRVVGAVRVRRRQDEDVEVVDQLARAPVDRVVAQQLLGGLQARQRRRPFTRVLLAVEEDADLRAVALLADAHDRVLERPALDVVVVRSAVSGSPTGRPSRAAARCPRRRSRDT